MGAAMRRRVKRLGLDDARERIASLERSYGMSSEEFYVKWCRGELDCRDDYQLWAALHDLLALKEP